MSKLSRLGTVILALASWSGVALHAQTVAGTILGSVQDQQGGVIGKVEVSAKNLENGAVRKTVSGDNGEYRIAGVPAGAYEVTATASGFKTEVRSGVSVTVGAEVNLPFALTVGAVSEKVEVTGEAAQVDTSSSAMGGFVNATTIRELPLNGRDWLQLALLQPGASFNTGQTQSDSGRAQKGNGLAISISGGRPSDNAFRIDGLVVNDYANAGPGSALHVNMGVDAIREFSVLTNNYSAEYGRGSGGVINAITKSGTNDIHGSAYYFHRNAALDARNFFDPSTIPAFRRHQYGGAIGGPIQKDKTFFFANYEALTESKGLSNNFDTISDNARNGLICANSACSTTRQITIPASVKKYLPLYPRPNGFVNGDTGKYLFGNPRIGDEKYVIGKVDHYFSSATTLFGNYSYDDTDLSVMDNYGLKSVISPSRRINGILSLQHVFSPTLISTTRFGISRTFAYNNLDSNPTTPLLTDKSLGFYPGLNVGVFTISGMNGAFVGMGGGFGTSGINMFGNTNPQTSEDLSWTKGRHSMRFGFNHERFIYNLTSGNRVNGEYAFAGVSDFLQGIPGSFTVDIPGTDTVRGERMSMFGTYFQDDFRIRPNLTINLGVRYEMGTVVTEVNGKLANLRNLTDRRSTVGDPYYNNPTTKNFAPRIGFAWDPFKDGKTAIRGGVAMFDIVPLPYIFVLRMPRAEPFYLSPTLSTVPASAFPNNIAPLLSSATTLRTAHVQTDPRRTYKGQWNLNIQRQLTKTMALTVGYVGTTGVRLANPQNDIDQAPLGTFDTGLNAWRLPIPATGQPVARINPNFGSINATNWSGHSVYHGLQTNLVMRPSKGLMYQLAYTFSKSIDDGSAVGNEASESSNTSGRPWTFCGNQCNRGVSDFNIPHNFVGNFLYDVPVLAAVKSKPFANAILGGWQIGGILTFQTGSAFSIKNGGDRAGTGSSVANTASGGQRPMFVLASGCNPNAFTGNIDNQINRSCFSFPDRGVVGNLGRNTFRMPTYRNVDFSVFKNQNLIGEKLKAQLRVEMFNVLNNTNLQATTITMFNGSGVINANFGRPTGFTVNQSRQIQLGLRLLF